jgi:hypothetical protein
MRHLLRSVCCLALLAPPVFAQKAGDGPGYRTRGDSASYEVAFDDAEILDGGQSAYGEWMKVRKREPKTMLLRARTSFVPEMLKSAGSF